MSTIVTLPTDGRAGQTVVMHVFGRSGQVWRAASSALVPYSSAEAVAGDYNTATSEIGGSGATGIFTCAFPSGIPAGAAYRCVGYISGVYALPVSDAGWVYWDGTNATLNPSTVVDATTAGVLTGPNSVTVTFRDASNVVVAGVPFTILGQGSGRAGTSGGSTGVATFGLPNGTYTLTVAMTNGVTFPNTTLTVSGTTSATVTGATSTLPTSSDPDQCAAYLDCYGRDGAPESGVTLHYQMMLAPATTATSFNRAPDETAASDASGRLVVTLARNATYDFWRGNGPRQRVIVGNVATLALPQILSAGST